MNFASQKSVVIVDDEKSYTDILVLLLSSHLDCRVVAFSRPLDALAALPDLDPGVIVTDYEMPQMNGAQFVAEASPLFPNVPFILITGHTAGAVDREIIARKARIHTVLAKPFPWRVLVEEILIAWPEPGVVLRRHDPFLSSV